MAWKFKSNTYEGRYLLLTITETVDPTTNSSKLSWTLSSEGGSSNYYTISATSVVIGGTPVYEKGKTAWDSKVFPAAKGSKSGNITVQHNSDGKKTITVEFVTSVYVGAPMDYGDSIKLTDIDRTAPTVTCSVSNVTSDSFKISASSSVTSDVWDYSLDGGTTWTQFNTTAGTSAVKSVTGLKANTTYSVKVRARKKSNYVYGTSTATSVKTLGASIIAQVYSFAADEASPVIKVKLTVYDASFFHTMVLRAGAKDVLNLNLGKIAAGTADKTIALTADQRAAVLDAFPDRASYKFNILLGTFTDSACTNRVGGDSYTQITATTSAALSAPTFTGFTFQDSNPTTVAVTGNNQILVQDLSVLRIICDAGTAKNGAGITSYSASVANVAKTSTVRTFEAGAITTSGDLRLTVSCTDSRGYATTVEKTVRVLEYEKPKLYNFSLRRKNEIEGMVQLSFGGVRSEIKADGAIDTNRIVTAQYRYKKTNDTEYGKFVSILGSLVISGASFSFASLELLELDAESSYHFHLQISDAFGTATVYDDESILPQGTPVVALRKRNAQYDYPRVGINNPNPKHPLDVNGCVAMNGQLVMGYAGTLTNGFDSVFSGIWYCSGSDTYDAPTKEAGFLEAFGNGVAAIQRYTTITGIQYRRVFNGSAWTNWM